MEKKKNKNKNDVSKLFVRRQNLTLGVKLVGTFAMTYYLLFFILLSIFGIYYRSVYNPEYSEESLKTTVLMSMLLWLIVGLIVFSLVLLFRRKRYGKFMFMFFTVALIVYQYFTTNDHVWFVYVLEALMALIMAPLRVVAKINKKIKDEIQSTLGGEEEKEN